MAFKMKNPSLMKMAKMAGDNRVAMKMKQQDAAMKMKKDPMKMKDPMDMKKDPMKMMKEGERARGKTAAGSVDRKVRQKVDTARVKKVKTKVGRETKTKTRGRAVEGAARAATAGTAGAMKMKKSPMKATYAEALKKDPKLAEYVKKRKSLTKGTPEWNANQNKINAAYGVSKRYPTGGSGGGGKADTSGIKSDRIINDKNTKSGTKTRGAAIGNKKVIQTTYDDGTRRQETKVKGKSAIEGKKIKQRNYDEKGNLTSKTKEKYRKRGGGGEGMADDYYKGKAKKIKTTTKYANTVTKTKTKFNKDGSVKRQVTKTRKRRFVGLGKLLGGKRAGQRT